jgi:hypothetical protein
MSIDMRTAFPEVNEILLPANQQRYSLSVAVLKCHITLGMPSVIRDNCDKVTLGLLTALRSQLRT